MKYLKGLLPHPILIRSPSSDHLEMVFSGVFWGILLKMPNAVAEAWENRAASQTPACSAVTWLKCRVQGWRSGVGGR